MNTPGVGAGVVVFVLQTDGNGASAPHVFTRIQGGPKQHVIRYRKLFPVSHLQNMNGIAFNGKARR